MAIHLDDKFKKELNFEIINENIDLNLNLISKYPRGSFLKQFIELKSSVDLPASPQKAIIEFMKIERLIDMPNDHMLNLTKLGYEIHRNGGWKKHLIREKAKANRDDKKAVYEFNNSKWKFWTFWPLLVLAAFGGTHTAYTIFFGNNHSKPDPTIERIESEINELRNIIIERNSTINEPESEPKTGGNNA